MRPPLWTLLAIPLLALGAWFVYKNAQITPMPVTGVATSTPTHVLACAPRGKDCVHTESTAVYDITVAYPNTQKPEQMTIEQSLAADIAQFKEDLGDSVPGVPGQKYALGVEYKAYTSAKYRSYEFDIYMD